MAKPQRPNVNSFFFNSVFHQYSNNNEWIFTMNKADIYHSPKTQFSHQYYTPKLTFTRNEDDIYRSTTKLLSSSFYTPKLALTRYT